jgi:hypothetical protein
LVHLAVGQNIQKGGLAKRNIEGLLQGIVKDDIPCGVRKVGENDGVLIGKPLRSCVARSDKGGNRDAGGNYNR